jgi:hypothetical protein
LQHGSTAIAATRSDKMKELVYVATFALETHATEIARAISSCRAN